MFANTEKNQFRFRAVVVMGADGGHRCVGREEITTGNRSVLFR